MNITLDLDPELEARLNREADLQGFVPSEYAARLLLRILDGDEDLPKLGDFSRPAYVRPTSPPAWLDDIKPLNPPEPGKTWAESFIGQWPGDETEEELLAMAQRIDDEDAGRI